MLTHHISLRDIQQSNEFYSTQVWKLSENDQPQAQIDTACEVVKDDSETSGSRTQKNFKIHSRWL